MNYLGLDFGTKHIGVAIATGPLAEPLTTIDTKSVVTALKSLVEKQSIDAIVVGVPDERENPPLKKLISDIAFLNLPIYLVDETLSTKDAQQALMHTTQTRRKQYEHSVAAALILQSYLDSHYTN